jgi:hypothetical protein
VQNRDLQPDAPGQIANFSEATLALQFPAARPMTCAAAFAVLLSACAAERAASPGADVRDPAALAAPPARARPSLLVPAAPPDSVPRAYYRDENVIESAPCTQGPLLSNILVVSFEPGSSRAERSAAVAAVGGAVVGGRPLSGFLPRTRPR